MAVGCCLFVVSVVREAAFSYLAVALQERYRACQVLAMLDRWHTLAVLELATMRKQQKWDERNTAKEWKVTKLERSGPKDGQSVGAWEAGKRLGDARWARLRNDAIGKGKL